MGALYQRSQASPQSGSAQAIYGDAGIPSFPAAAVAANDVSLAEVIRYISEFQLPRIFSVAAANLPQTSVTVLGTIAGGPVMIDAIVGRVTTVIGAAQTRMKLTFNPTAAGSSTDLCTILDINAHAVGTCYSITGTLTDPLQQGIWMMHYLPAPLILVNGTIDLDVADSNTGATAWHIIYRPMDNSSGIA